MFRSLYNKRNNQKNKFPAYRNIKRSLITTTKPTHRIYTGKVKAAILDWSGTTMDIGVIAPAVVFVDVFNKFKVPISMKEARLPMGLRKDLHIKAITQLPDVRKRWNKVYGRDPTDQDVNDMFQEFVPMQLACLPKYTTLLPETVNSVNILRKNFNLKIGTTTGFTKSMVDILLSEAKKQGYCPDVSVAGDEVYSGARPGPHMVHKNMDLLGIYPTQAVVKVDDTVTGVQEGVNGGTWAVGIVKYGNYMNLDSFEEVDKVFNNPDELKRRMTYTRQKLIESGAHYVIDTLADLPEVIDNINRRLAKGKNPMSS